MLETTARKDDYVSLISYVQRMEDARRAKQTLHWISDKKNRCRSRITWKDTVWRNTEPINMAWKDIRLKALNREEWKEWTVMC